MSLILPVSKNNEWSFSLSITSTKWSSKSSCTKVAFRSLDEQPALAVEEIRESDQSKHKQTAGEPIKIRQYMSVTEGAGKFGRVASNGLHLIGLKKIAWDFLANHWAKELRLAQAILLIELIGLVELRKLNRLCQAT